MKKKSDELFDLIKAKGINFKGHTLGSDEFFLQDKVKFSFALSMVNFPGASDLYDKLKRSLIKPTPLDEPFSIASDHCYNCGKLIDVRFDGVKLEAVPITSPTVRFVEIDGKQYSQLKKRGMEDIPGDPSCKYKKGFPEYSVTVDIPSGKIALANDLREFFPISNRRDYNVNYFSEKIRYSKAYARLGMAIHFVSNTCPNIYQIDSSHLEIGSYYDGEADKDLDPPGKNIGYICTDLWWYCAVDYEDLKNKMKEKGKYDGDITIAKVTPGRYRFTGNYYNCEDGESGVYSRIKLIKK